MLNVSVPSVSVIFVPAVIPISCDVLFDIVWRKIILAPLSTTDTSFKNVLVFVSVDDIVTTPPTSDNVILLPFLSTNVSVAPNVLLTLPSPLVSTLTVLKVLVFVSVALIVIVLPLCDTEAEPVAAIVISPDCNVPPSALTLVTVLVFVSDHGTFTYASLPDNWTA